MVTISYDYALQQRRDSAATLLGQVQEYLRRDRVSRAADPALTAAWTQFYRICSDHFRDWAASFPLSREDIEDVVQQVWVEVVRQSSRSPWGKNPDGFLFWFRVLLHHKCCDVLRQRQRWRERPMTPDLEHALTEPEIDAREAETQARVLEQSHLLTRSLEQQLSAENFQLFRRHFLEQEPVDEIAAALNLTRRQIYDRVKWLAEKSIAMTDELGLEDLRTRARSKSPPQG